MATTAPPTDVRGESHHTSDDDDGPCANSSGRKTEDPNGDDLLPSLELLTPEEQTRLRHWRGLRASQSRQGIYSGREYSNEATVRGASRVSAKCRRDLQLFKKKSQFYQQSAMLPSVSPSSSSPSRSSLTPQPLPTPSTTPNATSLPHARTPEPTTTTTTTTTTVEKEKKKRKPLPQSGLYDDIGLTQHNMALRPTPSSRGGSSSPTTNHEPSNGPLHDDELKAQKGDATVCAERHDDDDDEKGMKNEVPGDVTAEDSTQLLLSKIRQDTTRCKLHYQKGGGGRVGDLASSGAVLTMISQKKSTERRDGRRHNDERSTLLPSLSQSKQQEKNTADVTPDNNNNVDDIDKGEEQMEDAGAWIEHAAAHRREDQRQRVRTKNRASRMVSQAATTSLVLDDQAQKKRQQAHAFYAKKAVAVSRDSLEAAKRTREEGRRNLRELLEEQKEHQRRRKCEAGPSSTGATTTHYGYLQDDTIDHHDTPAVSIPTAITNIKALTLGPGTSSKWTQEAKKKSTRRILNKREEERRKEIGIVVSTVKQPRSNAITKLTPRHIKAKQDAVVEDAMAALELEWKEEKRKKRKEQQKKKEDGLLLENQREEDEDEDEPPELESKHSLPFALSWYGSGSSPTPTSGAVQRHNANQKARDDNGDGDNSSECSASVVLSSSVFGGTPQHRKQTPSNNGNRHSHHRVQLVIPAAEKQQQGSSDTNSSSGRPPHPAGIDPDMERSVVVFPGIVDIVEEEYPPTDPSLTSSVPPTPLALPKQAPRHDSIESNKKMGASILKRPSGSSLILPPASNEERGDLVALPDDKTSGIRSAKKNSNNKKKGLAFGNVDHNNNNTSSARRMPPMKQLQSVSDVMCGPHMRYQMGFGNTPSYWERLQAFNRYTNAAPSCSRSGVGAGGGSSDQQHNLKTVIKDRRASIAARTAAATAVVE